MHPSIFYTLALSNLLMLWGFLHWKLEQAAVLLH
jgi:hypothetical protein